MSTKSQLYEGKCNCTGRAGNVVGVKGHSPGISNNMTDKQGTVTICTKLF